MMLLAACVFLMATASFAMYRHFSLIKNTQLSTDRKVRRN